jgi:predicted Fe-Mo cluster-binding NifX family protein
MKIAITAESSQGLDSQVAQHFGHAPFECFTQAGIRTATGASGTVRASLESDLGGTLAAAAPCAESVAHRHG